MNISKRERKADMKKDILYDAMLSMADPATGKVAISGPQAGDIMQVGPATARTYLAGLIADRMIVQISETKRGTPTLYRIPALCKGDVRTTYTPTQPEVQPIVQSIVQPTLDKLFEAADARYQESRATEDEMFRAAENTIETYCHTASDIARSAMAAQDSLMQQILGGYMQMYKALEDIARGRD